MKKIILSILTCSTILLSNDIAKNDLSLMFGKANPHDKLNLKNDKSIGVAITIKDENTIFNQLELAWFNTQSVEFNSGLGNTDVNRFLFSGIKNYELNQKSSLYVLIGGGYENITSELNNVDSSAVLNWGTGFKYYINNSISFKAEIRQVIKEKRENTVLYHVGLVIPFINDSQNTKPKENELENKINSQIDMNTNIIAYFDSDKATIKDKYKIIIKDYVSYLKNFSSSKIVIEGHTDATASKSHNKSLAARRAMKVKKYMIDLGIESSRIRVESYGETMPVIDNKTRKHRKMNRRIKSKIIR